MHIVVSAAHLVYLQKQFLHLARSDHKSGLYFNHHSGASPHIWSHTGTYGNLVQCTSSLLASCLGRAKHKRERMHVASVCLDGQNSLTLLYRLTLAPLATSSCTMRRCPTPTALCMGADPVCIEVAQLANEKTSSSMSQEHGQ